MKALRTPLLTATLLSALAGSALAQMGPGNMPGQDGPHGRHADRMHEHKAGSMGERHARHLTELKAQLKLDASQESAWNSFAQAMQPPTRPAHHDRAAMEKLSTPERIDRMQSMHAQHDTEMKKHGEATKAFYASLNAEQKKTFDGQTARFMGRRGDHGMHGHSHF